MHGRHIQTDPVPLLTSAGGLRHCPCPSPDERAWRSKNPVVPIANVVRLARERESESGDPVARCGTPANCFGRCSSGCSDRERHLRHSAPQRSRDRQARLSEPHRHTHPPARLKISPAQKPETINEGGRLSTEGQPLDPFRARALDDFAGKRQAVADGQQHHLDTLILVNEDVESSDRIG